MSSLLSRITVSVIGLGSKALLNLGFCRSVTVNGLQNLTDALHDEERNNGCGIITMSNHISTLDDPIVWGILPTRYYWNTRTTRWVLGASDIIFTNPVFSVFFRNGQVLETFRGNGIFQPAVDTAIEKLNEGGWIHLFGEGKVNQPAKLLPAPGEETIPVSQHHANLLRFKWGVGRLVMEAKKPPIILPMWLTGFDELMPEGRSFPFKFLPRRNVDLSITFGKPIPADEITTVLKASLASPSPLTPPSQLPSAHAVFSEAVEHKSGVTAEQGWLGKDACGQLAHVSEQSAVEIERIRSLVTKAIQRNVETLGRQVAERTLKL